MTESDEEETLNLLKKICKMPMETTSSRIRTTATTIPEAIMVEIIARLPLISIARFKSVCQTWKSVIESAYFRSLFISLHRDSSSSWSLLFRTAYRYSIREVMGFHGCETWDLPKSPCSYIFPFQPYPNPNPNLPILEYFYRGSSNGLIWIDVSIRRTASKSFVGNPVLQEWVEIPPSPEPSIATGLITHVDEDGLVSSFKVVRTCRDSDRGRYEWRVFVYSSETGLWSFKRFLSSHPIHYVVSFYPPMNINGMLYLWVRSLSPTEPGVLIAHDFYGPEADDQCRVIPLPLPYNRDVKRCLTPSGGDAMYIEILDRRRLKVWRLNDNNSESSTCWQLLREEINMASVGFDVHCIPMSMNPFDSDILYLYSLQHKRFVSGNLKTKEFVVHEESENWSSSKGCGRINTHHARGYMKHARYLYSVVMLSQFVLPGKMDSVPRPPN